MPYTNNPEPNRRIVKCIITEYSFYGDNELGVKSVICLSDFH